METKTDILIYQIEDRKTKIDVRLKNKTVWMTQKAIAELYQMTSQNITLHVKNIYMENELVEEATCKNYLQVQNEGARTVKRNKSHYNLEMILAIGYRVRSQRGTQFRRWATERLKEVKNLGQDYFDELLERIRDIRASEKRFYKKITDIYALSIDYEANSEDVRQFYATVQNKLHFAIHGHCS